MNHQPERNLEFFKDNPPERRADASAALIHVIEGLTERVHELSGKLQQHIDMEPGEIEAAMNRAMEKGFPAGDPDGHRRHHELVIKAAEDRAKFWNTMKTEVMKWGIISVVGWLLLSAWKTFLMGPK